MAPKAHVGGPILPPGATTVTIAGQPAARITDRAECSCAIDMITEASTTVTIEGKLAARMTDPCVEGIIIGGEPTVLIGGPRGKQDPGQIVRDYQVQSETMKDWRPWYVFWVDPKPLTETEIKMLDALGPFGKSAFKDIAEAALQTARDRYPTNMIPPDAPQRNNLDWLGQDGHLDAFRHAYWNTRLTKKFGEEWARQYTLAHEGNPRNLLAREAMDLYNNEVGRAIAAHNPDASSEQLADLVQQAVERGDLLVIDKNGKLAWSNEVPLWEHGLAPEIASTGGQLTPDGDASPKNY